MSRAVLGCVGDYVILDGEFFKGEGSAFDVAGDELLALFVVEGVTQPFG